MNKKIFGKAAALSLAAVATLSTFAMTASADITYGDMNSISGTAYRIDWTLVKNATTMTADYNAVDNTVSFRTTSYAQTALTKTDTITVMSLVDNRTGISPVEPGSGSYYVSSNTQANTMKSNITSAINAQKNIADTDLDEWKKAWNQYVTDVKNYRNDTAKYEAAKEYLEKNPTVESREYTDSKGFKQIITSVSTNPHTEPVLANYQKATITVSFYTYTGNPGIVNKSMKQLSDELQTKLVSVTDGIITNGTDYSINISGSSSSGDDSTSSGTSTNTWYPALSAYRKPTTSGLSYQGYNGFWYTSQAAADYYGDGFSGITKSSNYSSTTGADVYFSAADGYYYASTALSGTSYCYLVYSGVYSSSYGSYRSANGYYYPTASAAQNASYAYNRSTTYTTYATTASARYFSMVTGKFYETAAAAQAAAPSYSSSYVIDLATYTGSTATDIYNIYDPYYYYYMMGGNGGYGTTTVDPDAPAIYGSAKRSGWNKILSVVKTTAKGKTVKIDMNASTVVPDDILTAAKAKGVNLQFVLANGATWTINASDIKSAETMNIDVEYNTKNIKSSLVSKAKKLNPGAVSTAQISVSGSGSLGVNADVTVKLSSKRAGCTVKAYIKTSSGSLKLVDKGVVNSNGKVTLDINQGGDYLLVVID